MSRSALHCFQPVTQHCKVDQGLAVELALEERGPDMPVDFLFLLSPFLLVPPASPADLQSRSYPHSACQP